MNTIIAIPIGLYMAWKEECLDATKTVMGLKHQVNPLRHACWIHSENLSNDFPNPNFCFTERTKQNSQVISILQEELKIEQNKQYLRTSVHAKERSPPAKM